MSHGQQSFWSNGGENGPRNESKVPCPDNPYHQQQHHHHHPLNELTLARLKERNSSLKSQLFSLTNEATTIEQDISHLVDLSMFSMYCERLDDGHVNKSLFPTGRSDPSAAGGEQIKRKLENDYKIALSAASSHNQNLPNHANAQGKTTSTTLARPPSAALGTATRVSDSIQPGTATAPVRTNVPSIPVPLKSNTFMPHVMPGYPTHKPQPVSSHSGSSSSTSIFPSGNSLTSSNPFIGQLPGKTTGQSAYQAPEQATAPPSVPSVVFHTATSVSRPRRVRSLPVNDEGNLLLPTVLGRANSRVSIYSIGRVAPNIPALHNETYIYPAGYISKRKFFSFLEPEKRVFYTCKILPSRPEALDNEPVSFQIILQSQPKNRFESSKMETLWSEFRAAFQPEQAFPDLAQFVNGEDFFGLEHDGVKKHIQEMPGARECSRYHFVEYVTRSIATNKKTNAMHPTNTNPGKATDTPNAAHPTAVATGLSYPMNLQNYAGFPWSQPGYQMVFQQPNAYGMGRNPLLDMFATQQPNTEETDEEIEEMEDDFTIASD